LHNSKLKLFIPCAAAICIILSTVPELHAQEPGQNPFREMVTKLFSQMDSHFQEKKGSVINIQDNTVYINLGEDSNIAPGMQFNVYRKGTEIIDPANPDNKGYVMEFICSIMIDLVQENISSGSVIESEDMVSLPRNGDIVRTKQPFLKIGFIFQESDSYDVNNFLQIAVEILSYLSEKTGRYFVIPTQNFQQAAVMEDASGTWKQRILKTARWLNVDVIVALQLFQTEWDLGLNGYLLSVKDQKVIDLILSTVSRSHQIDSIFSGIQKQETQLVFKNFISTIPDLNVRRSVLDATTFDVNGDGRDELFLLLMDEIRVYTFYDGVYNQPVILKFPNKKRSLKIQKNNIGKICACDLDMDGSAEIFARTSRYSVGYRWIYQNDRYGLYDHFYGYPVGMDNTPEGNAILLAKNVVGKDYFTGDLFYKYPSEGKQRYLNSPDRVIGSFYDFCTIYDSVTQNIVRMFLDLDNHLHFMTSTGGAYIQEQYYGLGMALGDVDRDHKPDIFVSSASLPGEPDNISMFEIEDNNIHLRWQSEFEDGSIYVVTLGDIDGNGKDDLIVAIEHGPAKMKTTIIKVFIILE